MVEVRNDKLSIVCVISSLAGGGAELVMSELAATYSDIGVAVTLVTLDPPTKKAAYSLRPAIRHVNLYVPFGRTPISKAFAHLKRLFLLRRLVTNVRPGSVLSFMTPTNITTLIACAWLPVRCVVSERTHPARFSYSSQINWLRKITYRLASVVVVQTPDIEKWCRGQLRAVIRVIPNFISDSRIVTSEVPRYQTIVAVGRLVPEKGFDDLINAFALLANQYPTWRLEILGEGSQRSLLEMLTRQHQLNTRVRMSGFESNPARTLSTAAIVAQPSRFEGFPNALLEAMAHGCAVVASKEAGEMLIQDQINGLLVPAGDVKELARALERLILDEKLREHLGRNASIVREQYSQNQIIKLWSEVLFPEHFFPA